MQEGPLSVGIWLKEVKKCQVERISTNVRTGWTMA